MPDAAIRTQPKQGLSVDMQVFEEVRLNNGAGSLWHDKDNRDNILFGRECELGKYFARFVERHNDQALFELKVKGQELASRSEPIDPAKGIPLDIKERLEQAYRSFHDKLSDPKATAEAKEFIQSLRMADPTKEPDMYRLYKSDGQSKLLVIWGCTRKGSKPLLPLEAINRLPTYRRNSLLLKLMGLLLGLSALMVALLLLLPLAGWQLPWMDDIRSWFGSTKPVATQQEPVVTPPTPPTDVPGDAATTTVKPQTNTTEPPFLFLAPRAIVAGDKIEVVPRTVGVLTMHGYQGTEYIHRKTMGVDGAESLTFFEPFMRIMTFKPDQEFPEERIEFVVFAQPEIRQNWVRITMPPGLHFDGSKIDWGDGDEETIVAVKEGLTQLKHAYKSAGSYTIRFVPLEAINWSAVTMPVTIATSPSP